MLNLFDRLPADFSSKYLGKKFLKIPQALSEDELKRLPNIASVDELLRNGQIGHDLVKIVRYYESSFEEQSLQTGDRLIDLDSLKEAMENGATMIVSKVHIWNTAAFELARSIHETFGVRGFTNFFCTPPDSRGLGPHFDPEDNIILQTGGTKVWKLYPDYEKRMEYPTRKTGFEREIHEAPYGEAVEITLRAGDLLYVPRGVTHAPYCTDTYSCHVTFAVAPHSWAEYISEAIDMLEGNDVEFRKPALTRPHSRRQEFDHMADALQPLLKKIASLDPSLVERRHFEKDAWYNGVFSHAPLAEVLEPVSPEMLAGQDFNLVLTERAYFRVFEDHRGVWRLWTYHYECELEPEVVEMLDVLTREKSVSGRYLGEKLGEEAAADVALSCQKFGIAGIELGQASPVGEKAKLTVAREQTG